MAKLDETSVVELLKELSDKLAGGEKFDEALAWKMVNDKVAKEAAGAPPKKKGARKEFFIILDDPDGKLKNMPLTGWVAQKDTEAPVDSAEDGSDIHAWEDDNHQLQGLIQIAHDTLMDDNSNKYTGKGFRDMIKYGRKTLKACGIVLKSQEVEAVSVAISDVPQWVVRAKAAGK